MIRLPTSAKAYATVSRAWPYRELTRASFDAVLKMVADGFATALLLAMLEIDEHGLDEMDKRILEALVHKFAGGPVGLNSLAVAIGISS